MDGKKKKRMLDDEALDQVVGGSRKYISNPGNVSVPCRSGPGYHYSTVYTLNNGALVYTVDKVYSEADGIYWSQLDDGCWVPSDLLA